MQEPQNEEKWLEYHGDRTYADLEIDEETSKKYVLMWDGENKTNHKVFLPDKFQSNAIHS